jgi:hypothetical protein
MLPSEREVAMRAIGTLLVCTVEVSDSVRVGAAWNGGPTIGIHVEIDGRTTRATSWAIWNPIWGVPLIDATRESFERFVVGRLSEPGTVDELVALATA